MNRGHLRQLGLISFSIAGIAYSPYQLLFEYATSRQVMAEGSSRLQHKPEGGTGLGTEHVAGRGIERDP
ncbi:hypothetical protein [Paenibacillus sp. 32352]|uniref:hypothetical protein n=1 Tax=Paenibacillus sp. 32352 TaxID=1969111 RepID=UPI0015C49CB9|nr:hypothetical protein [Paenibacillus sp. 32352]